LIVSPDSRSDALWSAEKALANRACGMVLLWHDDRREKACSRIDPHAIRRLQVAAQTGHSLLFLYRRIDHDTTAVVLQHSWAAVRLLLSGAGDECLAIEILKARGGRCPAPIVVNIEHGLSPLAQTHSLSRREWELVPLRSVEPR
jgi:protein ImuA